MRAVNGVIHVIAGQVRSKSCRERGCGQPIDLRLNTNGNWMPFTRGAVPLHREQHPVTYVKYELMSRDDLHFARCQRRRQDAQPGAHA